MGEITKTAADLIAWQKVRIADLEAALDKYGQHEPGCGARDFSGWECTCDLDTARKGKA